MKVLMLLAISSTLVLTSCASNESKKQAELEALELLEVAGDLQDSSKLIGEKQSQDILKMDNSSRNNDRKSIISTNNTNNTNSKKTKK